MPRNPTRAGSSPAFRPHSRSPAFARAAQLLSGYGAARTMAAMLCQQEVADLLEETLKEEKDTDETLTEITEAIMMGAEEEGEIEDEETRS